MLGCFPEDDSHVAQEEWTLLQCTIARHKDNFDLDILSKVENLKLVYNIQARKHGKDEIELNLSIKPWQRSLAVSEFAMRVVQEIKYEDAVKAQRDLQQKSPAQTRQAPRISSTEEGKRSRQMEVDEDDDL